MTMPEAFLVEKEITRIASQLLGESQRDAHGLYWLTYNRLPGGELFWQPDESIFTGTTGITLFFVALYQYSGDDTYLQAAREGTRWAVRFSGQAEKKEVSFYSGHSGVVYLCCKLYEASRDATYLKDALQLVAALSPTLKAGNGISDLTSGEAGNLFVLTYLYALTGDREVLRLIQTGIDRLIQQALLSRQGLKWGYKPNSLDSLCGLSHGASGIGYVFLELSRYFRSKALRWLAEQAFLYERQYFRKRLCNWLDLRVYSEHLDAVETLHKRRGALLVKGGDVNAWAHRTAGIGLIRLRALEVTGREVYRSEAQAAVTKTLRDLSRWQNPVNYSLSSSLGGLSELLVTASVAFANAGLLQRARRLTSDAINLRAKVGYYPSVWGPGRECPSLLLGKAGIGYSFLRVLDTSKVGSVLLPRLPAPEPAKSFYPGTGPSPWQQPSLTEVRHQVWGSSFKRTLFVLSQLVPGQKTVFFKNEENQGETKELAVLQDKLWAWIQTLPRAVKPVAHEIFRLEKERIKLLTSHQHVIYREVKRQALLEQADAVRQLPDPEFLQLYFRTCGHIRILSNRWSWESEQPAVWQRNLRETGKSHPVMLVSDYGIVEEYPLSPFAASLLKSLRKKGRVDHLISRLVPHFPGQPEQVKKSLTPKVIAQLKQFSREGLVEISSEAGGSLPASRVIGTG